MLKVIIQTCLLITVIVLANEDAPETVANQGVLRGKYLQTWKGRKFSSFTGIPYAKPPVGNLRFKLAVPAEPWNGILDASKAHAVCPQVDVFFNNYTIIGDENCLYLNVYTPQLSDFNKHRLPVMFFIHGGGWTCGASNPAWYGPKILLDKDIILVTANYRLGALGFLSTANEVVPGNNGLKDQTLVLRWIKDNIENFGGDPQKITIFGQSAGGASSHYHMISPMSKDLISGAIAHSGVATAGWALAPKSQGLRNTKRLAKFLNCPIDCIKNMVNCLRNVDPYAIVEQDKKFNEWAYEPMIPFKPVIEPDLKDAFLTKHPIDIIKSGAFANVPFMTGFTSEDGAIKSAAFYNDTNLIKDLDKDFSRLVPLIIQYHETASDKDHASKMIRDYYFGNGNVDDTTKAELTDMITDGMFVYPQNMAARLHAKYSKKPVYYFVFGYRGSISLAPFFGDPSHDYGVCHGDELNYLLSGDLFGEFKRTEADQQMIEVLTTLWTNFAATGNPTPNTESPISTKWGSVKSDKLSYYVIKGSNDIKMVDDLYQEQENFWNSLSIDAQISKIKDEL